MGSQLPHQSHTAPIHEYRILWTAQKRQKLKLWHDGFLRLHTFNNRMLIYDDSRSLVADLYRKQLEPPAEGDELEFEQHLVTVEEFMTTVVQDLTPVFSPAIQRRAQASARKVGSPIVGGETTRGVNGRAAAQETPVRRGNVQPMSSGRGARERPLLGETPPRQPTLGDTRSGKSTTNVPRQAKPTPVGQTPGRQIGMPPHTTASRAPPARPDVQAISEIPKKAPAVVPNGLTRPRKQNTTAPARPEMHTRRPPFLKEAPPVATKERLVPNEPIRSRQAPPPPRTERQSPRSPSPPKERSLPPEAEFRVERSPSPQEVDHKRYEPLPAPSKPTGFIKASAACITTTTPKPKPNPSRVRTEQTSGDPAGGATTPSGDEDLETRGTIKLGGGIKKKRNMLLSRPKKQNVQQSRRVDPLLLEPSPPPQLQPQPPPAIIDLDHSGSDDEVSDRSKRRKLSSMLSSYAGLDKRDVDEEDEIEDDGVFDTDF